MSIDRSRRWTVLELLRWTCAFFEERGLPTARLDAECLLAHALGCDRLRLYLEFDKPVAPEERAGFRELVRRRAEERVPVAQLTGRKEFWSLSFAVTPDVLVPRPETETLVEAALELAPDREAELRILDLGTGSGAVALALASELPKSRITATDLSAAALAVAGANAERLGFADRVRLLEGDLFDAVPGERFDLVVSNPPYVAERDAAELAPELAHEPAQALFAGADGTALLARIVVEAPSHLEEAGGLALELAPEQLEALRAGLAAAGFGASSVHRDLAGRPRVVTARREAAAARADLEA
jgi:release factor glutamine methyltransferase